ncbi:major facilitator superfamily domain-containing protein [Fusarium venenatum]|uniref:major facilitator superfamily domain-containing protein n=1 Tax=Fusarium venenatum TaxID=56646 RepID=UPI001DE7CE32|nr:major facilitator superfamily domain-containing protein [Fusarium venenatum]
MGLGVLPDRRLADVPGTSFLSEKGLPGSFEEATTTTGNHANLKHDPTGKIVLVPQPSDDPNDPLNWPAWRKHMFTVSIIIGCGSVGAVGPLLCPAMVPLAGEFDVPLQRFTLGFTGSLLISLAFGNLFCNSLAMVVGKRPVYLFTTVGLLVTTIWSAVAKDFISLAVSRSIQGLCMSPMEALVPASISDVWFVHQRGLQNAIFNLGVLGGINLASPISGTIINAYGYKTCLWSMAGAFGVQLLLTFFFMPETTYKRDNDSATLGDTLTKKHSAADDKKEFVSEVENTVSARDSMTIPGKHAYIYTLRPWSGYWDSSGFTYSIYAPFKMLGSPVVVWGCFQFTICINWLVLLANTQSQIFSAPPYNFSVAQVGLTNLSSFVGTFIATALAGVMVDGLAKFMAGRNQGVYEPEFRLPILALLATLSASGFFGWGQSLANAEPWPIPVILCLGLINLGIQLGVVGVVSYVVDSHRHEAVESFAMMSFAKNIFGFGMTFYMNDWIALQGVRDAFFVVGGITIAVSMATVPMYIFGKRARSFAFRNGVLA